jgi:hypothetical protein
MGFALVARTRVSPLCAPLPDMGGAVAVLETFDLNKNGAIDYGGCRL